MEQEILIAIVALFSSILTFFSGFGLGTLLLPVFALFFSIEIAIGLTGVVHLLGTNAIRIAYCSTRQEDLPKIIARIDDAVRAS